MCGIIGYVGKAGRIEDLINGLKTLEYRGYDSSGIAYFEDKPVINKAVGKIASLEEEINQEKRITLGIGHTRWATQGAPTTANAHPHQSGKIILVHNGIIENESDLRAELLGLGYKFNSDTDTEVAAAYIDYLYKGEDDMVSTLIKCTHIFKGSYALGVILSDDPNHLYAVRKESPLIIGVGKDENLIASDVPAILGKTKDYILLNNFEIAVLSSNEIVVYDTRKQIVEKEVLKFDGDVTEITKAGFEHYMLKEINEIPKTLKDTLDHYYKDNNWLFDVDLCKYKEIDIVACGSAYHAGLVGKYVIEDLTDIRVNCHLASEYRYQKNYFHKDKLVIIISQSGETADSLAALELANDYVDTLAIVNVVNSSIARNAKKVVYTRVGHEIAVATTKAYTAQVLVLILLALKASNSAFDFKTLFKSVSDIINLNIYEKLAKTIHSHKHVFFLGRGVDYGLGLEGSLKLKEISYIHSEAYAAGELKHGTMSLIETGTPVIALISDEVIADKTISNVRETRARGSYVIVITNEKVKVPEDIYDEIIVLPYINKIINPILTVVPLQLISYYTAKELGCDVDQPRNLAKSVTVE